MTSSPIPTGWSIWSRTGNGGARSFPSVSQSPRSVFAPLSGDLATLTTLPVSLVTDRGQQVWPDGRVLLASSESVETFALADVLVDNAWVTNLSSNYWSQASYEGALAGPDFLCQIVSIDDVDFERTECWFNTSPHQLPVTACYVMEGLADLKPADVAIHRDTVS